MTILILFVVIVLNGVFAMSEMALVSARKARLQKRIDEGDQGSIAAEKLAEDPANFMSTMQIGISTITILSGILGEAALADPVADFLVDLGMHGSIAHTLSLILVVAIITYVNIVVGELAPKRLGQIAPEKVARVVSRLMADDTNATNCAFFIWINVFGFAFDRHQKHQRPNHDLRRNPCDFG
ncbi:MAG: hypothetical protein NVS3B3_14370 [Aquirhabdus sp.]